MKNFQNFSVTDYLRIVRHRKWYLVLPAVLVSTGACVYAWRAPSIYRSETTIQVTNRILPEDYIGSIVRTSVADQIDFARQQVLSRTFVERIVQDLQIAGGTSSDGVISNVSNGIEFTLVPPNSFKLAYVATDPSFAQAVVRRLAERITQLNEGIRKKTVDTGGQFLDEQMRQADKDVSELEEKLKSFNDRNFHGLPVQLDVNAISELEKQLAAIESELGDLTQSRSVTERRLQEQNDLRLAGASILPQPTPRSAPARAVQTQPPTQAKSELEKQLESKNAELTALLGRYGEAYPAVEMKRLEIRKLEAQVKEEHELQALQPKPTPPPAAEEVTPEETPSILRLPGLDETIGIADAELKFEINRQDRYIAAKEREKQDISGKIAQYRRRLNLPAELTQEMEDIERNLKAARDRNNLLFGRKVSLELSARVDLDTNNETFKVIDAANLPQTPAGPKRLLNAAFGILTGILVGCGLVFAREYVDTTLLDEEDALAELKLPILTSVPIIQMERRKRRITQFGRDNTLATTPAKVIDMGQIRTGTAVLDSLGNIGTLPSPAGTFSLNNVESRVRSVIQDHQSIAGEQYRVLRTALSLMRRKREKFQTILISSTIPSEGKTFSSCALAGVLAQESGKRVLLIDADLRTGNGLKMLGIAPDNLTSGFCEILRDNARIEENLLKCTDLNLYFLPAGKLDMDPTGLLSGPAIERMIRRCEELFDWVIIDSPPILALADAKILHTACDAVLLVVRAEKTPTKLIKDSVRRIGNEHICGVLMNGVRNIASSRYYGRYYKNQGRNN